MIKEFDSLAITTDNYDKLSKQEINERVKKREELLSKMSRDEINQLLKRPYPPQFKAKLKKFL